MGGEQDAAPGIGLLDFLFTVSIGIGLTPEVLGQPHLRGLLSEDWMRTSTWPDRTAFFNMGVFALGFLTLTLSWFGYHASMRERPLQYDTVSGMFRFIIDVFLVIVYGLILLEFRNFDAVLLLILVVHLTFVVWDGLKVWEHWVGYKATAGSHLERYRREYVSVVFLFLFMVLWGVSGCLDNWVVLGLGIALTILYRINKIHPLWERLLLRAGEAR